MGIGLRVSSEGGAGDGGHVSLNFNHFLRICEYNRQAGSATDHRHLFGSFQYPCFQLYSGMHVFLFVFLHSKVVGAIEYIKMYYTRTALLGGSPLDRRCLCSNVPRREPIRLVYTV